MTDEKPAPRQRRTPVALVVAALAALLAAAAIGGRGGAAARDGPPACPAAKAVAARLAPLAQGEVAALNVNKNPKPAVGISFVDGDGRKLTLADFKGRNVLLNLWATWCVP